MSWLSIMWRIWHQIFMNPNFLTIWGHFLERKIKALILVLSELRIYQKWVVAGWWTNSWVRIITKITKMLAGDILLSLMVHWDNNISSQLITIFYSDLWTAGGDILQADKQNYSQAVWVLVCKLHTYVCMYVLTYVLTLNAYVYFFIMQFIIIKQQICWKSQWLTSWNKKGR